MTALVQTSSFNGEADDIFSTSNIFQWLGFTLRTLLPYLVVRHSAPWYTLLP